MANVRISPVFNDAQFVSNGDLLAGGKIYTFAASSNTQQRTTYTDNTGRIENPNPIVLDSSGRLPNELWLIENLGYQLILTDRANNTITTHNNILGLPNPPANLYYKSVAFQDNVFYSNDGEPLSNGKIYSYLNNTFSIKIPTYADSTGNTPNPNPIVLSNSGTLPAGLYLDNNKKYNLVLTDSNGTTILKNYNGAYGELDLNVPSPTIDLFTFIPTPVVVGGFPYELDWETSNAIAVTYEITANISGNITPVANGAGGVDGNITGTAQNQYWSMTGNLVAEGAPGANPLFAYATANVLVSTVYTSGLYPYYLEDEIEIGNILPQSGSLWGIETEEMDIGMNVVSANLEAIINFINYNDGEVEELDVSMNVVSGNLEAIINYINYNEGEVEEMDIGMNVVSGNLQAVINYINYNNYPTEEMDIGMNVVSASLT